jgi:hypothetical protein
MGSPDGQPKLPQSLRLNPQLRSKLQYNLQPMS